MQKPDNPLDQHLRAMADGQEMDFNMDKVWNAVEQRRKRRPAWWILCLGLVGISAVSVAYFLLSRPSPITNATDTITHNASDADRSASPDPTSSSTTIQKSLSSDDINRRLARDKSATTSSSMTAKSLSDQSPRPSITTSAAPSSPIASARDQMNSKRDDAIVSTNSSDEDAIIKHEQSVRTAASFHEIQPHKASSPTNRPSPAESSKGVLTGRQTAPTSIRLLKEQAGTSKPPTHLPAKDHTTPLRVTAPLALQHAGLLTTPNTSLPTSKTKNNWSICKVREQWVFGGEVFTGYVRGFDQYSTKPDFQDIDGAAYRSAWEEAETMHGGYQVGLSAFVQAPSGFEVMLGIDYTDMEEELSVNRTITTVTQTYDPMAYFIIDDMGNRVWVGDTVTTTSMTTRTRRAGKDRRLLNIPLRLGYMHRHGDWAFGGHIGAAIQISNTYEGPVMQPDLTTIELDKDNMGAYWDDGVRISGLANLHVGRYLNDHWQIFFRPAFRYHPDPWDSANHPLTLDMHLASALVGLRYEW